MAVISGGLNRQQLKAVKAAIRAAELPPARRRRLLWRLAKYAVIPATKRSVRSQATPDGVPWAPRRTHQKGRMLKGMPARLKIHELTRIDGVRIYPGGASYGRTKPGVVGFAQQNGATATVSARQVTRGRRGNSDRQRGMPASVGQARRLRKAGYKVRGKRGWRKPGMKEIQTLLNAAQAGLILRKLEGRPAQKSWTLVLPSRPFLGISDADLLKGLTRELRGIGFGADMKQQNRKG